MLAIGALAALIVLGYELSQYSPATWGPESDQYAHDVRQQVILSEQISRGDLFFGDSIMVAFDSSSVSANSANLAISGDTIDGLLGRLPKYRLNPARSFIVAIGTNNVLQRNMDGFEGKAAALVRAFPQAARLTIFSTPPFGRGWPDWVKGVRDRANTALRNACAARAGCVFLDPSLALPDGSLAPQFDSGDGVHLSAGGYRTWTAALRKRF